MMWIIIMLLTIPVIAIIVVGVRLLVTDYKDFNRQMAELDELILRADAIKIELTKDKIAIENHINKMKEFVKENK